MAVAGVGAALVASACCIGPVAFALMGVGAQGASAVALEPYRPWFIGLTMALVGVAFASAYRPAAAQQCREDGVCGPGTRTIARVVAWIAVLVAAALIAFPYYIGWFV